MTRRKHTYENLAIYVAYGVIFFFGYHVMVNLWLPGQLTSSQTRQEYRQEFSKLGPSGTKAGIDEGKQLDSECIRLKTNYFSSSYSCITMAVGNIRYTSTDTYKKVSAELLSKLRSNGWQVANQTEYKNSPDHLLDVAYFKNDGTLSCNLKISSDQVNNQIFINGQTCGKTISVFDINLAPRAYGP